jgi:carboxypeptidase Q
MKLVQSIGNNYLSVLNASQVTNNGHAADTSPLFEKGIPTMVNLIEDNDSHDYYFRYHHSAGDTMSIMNADLLDGNVIGIAAMFYILADL